jgi:uncharacterized protein Usg
MLLSDEPEGQQTETRMSLALQLKDYRLTTARIYYHMPDYPGVLQTYVWQELDMAPEYPELRKFLEFWNRTLDGKLHSVNVGSARHLQPGRWRHQRASFALH